MEFNKEVSIALGKLFKDVSLKGERVELGLVEDLDKMVGNFVASRKKIDKLTDEVAKYKKAANSVNKEVKDSFKKAAALLKNVEKAAKELGVKPKGINGYDTLSKLSVNVSKEAEALAKGLN